MNDFSHTTFSQQIASVIEGRIRSGEYKVGDRLPTEPQLSIRFGVSRGTIREALKSLVSIGLLESRQGSGTYVMANDRLEAAFTHTLSASDPEDIMNTRKLLERSIASSAALERTDEELRRLGTLLDDVKVILDPDERMERLHLFHLTLASSTHNRLLYTLYSCISGYCMETYGHAEDVSFKEISNLHEELYEAVGNHDAEMAADIMSRITEI